MGSFLRRRRPLGPAAAGLCERCGVACDARCRADTVREQGRASAFAFRLGMP
jgi:hypothetical protein